MVAKSKPLATRFVDIFGDWIKQQTGEVSQYAEMFRHVSYFRYVEAEVEAEVKVEVEVEVEAEAEAEAGRHKVKGRRKGSSR